MQLVRDAKNGVSVKCPASWKGLGLERIVLGFRNSVRSTEVRDEVKSQEQGKRENPGNN